MSCRRPLSAMSPTHCPSRSCTREQSQTSAPPGRPKCHRILTRVFRKRQNLRRWKYPRFPRRPRHRLAWGSIASFLSKERGEFTESQRRAASAGAAERGWWHRVSDAVRGAEAAPRGLRDTVCTCLFPPACTAAIPFPWGFGTFWNSLILLNEDDVGLWEGPHMEQFPLLLVSCVLPGPEGDEKRHTATRPSGREASKGESG